MDRFPALVSAGLARETLPYITARFPEIATLEDLVAYNAAGTTRRIPFGQALAEAAAPQAAGIDSAAYDTGMAAAVVAASEALDAAFAQSDTSFLVSLDSLHSPIHASAGYPTIPVPLGLRTCGGRFARMGLHSARMPPT
jgi:hypothetical protein